MNSLVLCILTSFWVLCTPKSCLKYFFSAVFNLISGVKSLKKVWNEQKRLKTSEKSSSTSFWVCAAPKSWLKYTTTMAILSLKLNQVFIIILIFVQINDYINFFSTHLGFLGYPFYFILVFRLPSRGKVGKNQSTQKRFWQLKSSLLSLPGLVPRR